MRSATAYVISDNRETNERRRFGYVVILIPTKYHMVLYIEKITVLSCLVCITELYNV